LRQLLIGRRELGAVDVKAHKDIKAQPQLGALQISGGHKDARYDAGLREQVLPNLQVSMQLSVSQVALMNSFLRRPPCRSMPTRLRRRQAKQHARVDDLYMHMHSKGATHAARLRTLA